MNIEGLAKYVVGADIHTNLETIARKESYPATKRWALELSHRAYRPAVLGTVAYYAATNDPKEAVLTCIAGGICELVWTGYEFIKSGAILDVFNIKVTSDGTGKTYSFGNWDEFEESEFFRRVTPRNKLDPYEVLGVSSSSPFEEVRRAYRAAAMRTHPDRNGNPEEFKRVTEAYKMIKDAQSAE